MYCSLIQTYGACCQHTVCASTSRNGMDAYYRCVGGLVCMDMLNFNTIRERYSIRVECMVHAHMSLLPFAVSLCLSLSLSLSLSFFHTSKSESLNPYTMFQPSVRNFLLSMRRLWKKQREKRSFLYLSSAWQRGNCASLISW